MRGLQIQNLISSPQENRLDQISEKNNLSLDDETDQKRIFFDKTLGSLISEVLPNVENSEAVVVEEEPMQSSLMAVSELNQKKLLHPLIDLKYEPSKDKEISEQLGERTSSEIKDQSEKASIILSDSKILDGSKKDLKPIRSLTGKINLNDSEEKLDQSLTLKEQLTLLKRLEDKKSLLDKSKNVYPEIISQTEFVQPTVFMHPSYVDQSKDKEQLIDSKIISTHSEYFENNDKKFGQDKIKFGQDKIGTQIQPRALSDRGELELQKIWQPQKMSTLQNKMTLDLENSDPSVLMMQPVSSEKSLQTMEVPMSHSRPQLRSPVDMESLMTLKKPFMHIENKFKNEDLSDVKKLQSKNAIGMMNLDTLIQDDRLMATVVTDTGDIQQRKKISLDGLSLISNQIRDLKSQGGGEIRVRLQPENLGELFLKVSTQGSQVFLQIQTADEKVKRIVTQSLGALKDSLSTHHLVLSQCDVSVQSGPLNHKFEFQSLSQDKDYSQSNSSYSQNSHDSGESTHRENKEFRTDQRAGRIPTWLTNSTARGHAEGRLDVIA